MSDTQQTVTVEKQQSIHSTSSSNSNSPSNSISLIKLDELSSFGATKQSRLPALIKLNGAEQQQTNSMPADLSEQQVAAESRAQQVSLPAQLAAAAASSEETKENQQLDTEDFHMLDTDELAVGPSLPQPQMDKVSQQQQQEQQQQVASIEPQDQLAASKAAFVAASEQTRQALASSLQLNSQHPSHLGDSLIEMIVNLRNENQNLVRALETNNEYVKERLSEFKRFNEEAKRREAQFALEKAEFEHQARKLQRQNLVLSERLKSMEAKLKEMKLEVSDSLAAAHSSRASSAAGAAASGPQLYPSLGNEPDSFSNAALQQVRDAGTTDNLDDEQTMQIDAASGELLNNHSHLDTSQTEPTAPPMNQHGADVLQQASTSAAQLVGSLSKDELARRFDADKAEFLALDDPMKQVNELETQLNGLGGRDYEVCLLQQELNIYRQDFRLKRIANLEAKIQIEQLKNAVDQLCLERLKARSQMESEDETTHAKQPLRGAAAAAGVRFGGAATAAADAVLGKLGQQLNKKAARSAHKAAKYAAKVAHREEKAAAAVAASAAKAAARAASSAQQHASASASGVEGDSGYQHHHHHHSRARRSSERRTSGAGLRGVRSEVMNDLLSTANKAMLTGYKMASTHVNLALDKLSQYEQAQASNLAQNQARDPSKPSGPPSVD